MTSFDKTLGAVGAFGAVAMLTASRRAHEQARHEADMERRANARDKAELFGWLSAFGVGLAVAAGLRHLSKARA